MGTVVQTLDILSARPDVTNTPERVYINGTNFPPAGYAFPQSSSKAIYLGFRASTYGGGNLTLVIPVYSRSGSTSGTVQLTAALAAVTAGDAVSMESKSFATSQNASATINATAKGDTAVTITISNLDSLSNGDDCEIKITRTDTSMVGDAILFGKAELSYSDGNSGTPGSGDFVGPASATDTALVRYSGTTGKLGQNSAVSCDASGNLTGVGTINTLSLAAHASRHLPGGADTVFAGTWVSVDIPKWSGSAWIPKYDAVIANTADQTVASVTQTALTSLSFALPRAGTYYFQFELQTATNTAATTQVYSVSYSGTTTGGIANANLTTTVSTFAVANTTTFTTSGTMSGTRTTITTVFPVRITGTITVSTSGTLALNGASGSASNALVVKARSGGFCKEA